MFKEKHISFIIGLVLVLISALGSTQVLLIKDIENLEKRELEEKLKESSGLEKKWLNKFYLDGGNNDLSGIFISYIPPHYLSFSFAPVPSFFCPAPGTTKTPLFLLYCSLKIPCC